MNPTETKKLVKDQIMAAVNKGIDIDKSKLCAQLSLDTGFKEDTINQIFGQLKKLGYIKIEDNVVRKGR